MLSSANEDVACPVEHLAIPEDYLDLESRHYTKAVPRRLREDLKYAGDATVLPLYNEDEDVPSTDGESDDSTTSEDNHDSGATGDLSDDDWESASDNSVD